MSTTVALAVGFGAGAATVLAALAVRWRIRGRRRSPGRSVSAGNTPSPRPRPSGTPPVVSRPTGPAVAAEPEVPANTTAEREVAAAWLQFLRREVGDTVGAINSRLSVAKTLLAGLAREELTASQRDAAERIAIELERAAGATAALHEHVSSSAPKPARPSVTTVRPRDVRSSVIMVVESDDTTREVLGEVFRGLGHRVVPVRDGVEAFTILQAEPIDCVVSETRVSRLSGTGLYTQVEERLPHVARRFVFVSGDTQQPEVRAFLERTGCPLIPKPFDAELLVEAVNEVLEAVARDGAARPSGPVAG